MTSLRLLACMPDLPVLFRIFCQYNSQYWPPRFCSFFCSSATAKSILMKFSALTNMNNAHFYLQNFTGPQKKHSLFESTYVCSATSFCIQISLLRPPWSCWNWCRPPASARDQRRGASMKTGRGKIYWTAPLYRTLQRCRSGVQVVPQKIFTVFVVR